ncbi:MAG: response regulator transcription factor [Clostridia bacterium]|nr:response regulator transcription factor [Clostridia bacterium]
MTPIRVLVADDHPLFRQGLRRALEFADRLEVVGEARDGYECLERVRALRPDVILLDLTMPKLNGVEVARQVKSEWPEVRILVLTMHDNEEYLVEAVQAGVDGYVVKDVEPGELQRAILRVAAGERYLQPDMAAKLMTGFQRLAREAQRREAGPLDILSDREWQILQLMVAGKANKEIGDALFISEKTVKNHTTNLFRKLGVQGRAQAVVEAIRRGWVRVDEGPTGGSSGPSVPA